MEKIKELEHFFDPDPRNLAFVRLDRVTGEKSEMKLEDHYQLVTSVELHGGVPDRVRSYFETVRTLILYGWLYYSFYALSQNASAMAVEIALRVRLPKQGNDRRGLADLFKEAVKKGVIGENDFPMDSFRNIRNSFTHLQDHWILPPGYAIEMLGMSAELINALWPKP